MPSQGVATTFGGLNVHMEPSRQSPSFVQVKEKEKVDVIAHKVVERTTGVQRRQLIPLKPKLEKRTKEKASKYPLPSPPPAPEPPPEWVELSQMLQWQRNANGLRGPDDWTLIRTEGGRADGCSPAACIFRFRTRLRSTPRATGLRRTFPSARSLTAMYKRTSGFGQPRTLLGEDHDFDGYRVFVWSLRHHRYETAYIQRRERGFFPVLAKTGEFSVCLENEDGSRVRKQYTMMGNAVRPAGMSPCDKAPDAVASPEQLASAGAAKATGSQTEPYRKAQNQVQRYVCKITTEYYVVRSTGRSCRLNG